MDGMCVCVRTIGGDGIMIRSKAVGHVVSIAIELFDLYVCVCVMR